MKKGEFKAGEVNVNSISFAEGKKATFTKGINGPVDLISSSGVTVHVNKNILPCTIIDNNGVLEIHSLGDADSAVDAVIS